MKILWVIVLVIFCAKSFSQSEIDQKLRSYIERFNYQSVKKLEKQKFPLYEIGKKLFSDKNLSLTNEISCQGCHQKGFGGSEPLPLSLGTGASGQGESRFEHNGEVLARNTPSLIGRGQFMSRMFWDGRVTFHPRELHFITPIEELNGDYPEYFEIVDALGESALAAQALFPIISPDEMAGKENAHLGHKEIWELIEKKIFDQDSYKTEFKKIIKNEKLNIGHIAKALSDFITVEFQVNRTNFDRYIDGDSAALSMNEKKGFVVFNEQGFCFRCHNGPGMTNQTFHNILVAPIGPGKKATKQDFGLEHFTGKESHRYRFLVPGLRGISQSAPYFHNGSAVDLEAVINHYNQPTNELNNYDGRVVNNKFSHHYNMGIEINKNPYHLFAIREKKSPLVQNLSLTTTQKNWLKQFLLTL
jgi:cytochrome c peroxidase